MKVIKITLALLVVIGLIVAAVGCEKTTGGGWFYNNGNIDQKVTFGFNAQPVGDMDAKGQFELQDHSTKTNIHGTFNATLGGSNANGLTQFTGTCKIDGQGGHTFAVWFYDAGEPGPNNGDGLAVWIDPSSTDPVTLALTTPTYTGTLDGGNIQVHTK